MRVDSHQHFWSFSRDQYGWIVDGGLKVLERDFLPSDLEPLLDAHGMAGSVAVQARQSLEESRWLLELAAQSPRVLGVVGWVDLRAADVARDIAHLREGPGGEHLVGIRHVVQDEAPGFLDGARFRRGVGALTLQGLVYDLLIYAHQFEEAVRFAAAVDGVPMVLDHIGKPKIASGERSEWNRSLRALAALEHVSVKVSGLVTEADHRAWTKEQLLPYLDDTLEAFGAGRLLFGTDWPVCTLAATYVDVVEIVEGWASALSSDERNALFGGNAARVYGLTESGA